MSDLIERNAVDLWLRNHVWSIRRSLPELDRASWEKYAFLADQIEQELLPVLAQLPAVTATAAPPSSDKAAVDRVARRMFDALMACPGSGIDPGEFGYKTADPPGSTILDGAYDLADVARAVLDEISPLPAGQREKA